MDIRNGAQRLLCVGPRAEGAESGANILINNIVGILVGLVFLGIGIAWYIGSIDSAKTTASESMMTTIATKVQQYYNDNGSYPGALNTWDTSFFSNTQYFATPPIDPAAPNTSSQYAIYVYDGGLHFFIQDWIGHPVRTLSGLPRFGYTGSAAYIAGPCDNTCSEINYSDVFGMMGQ